MQKRALEKMHISTRKATEVSVSGENISLFILKFSIYILGERSVDEGNSNHFFGGQGFSQFLF